MLVKNKINDSEMKLLKTLVIFERFAIAFSNNAEINKTHLQLQSRLCWNLFNRYLDLFLKKGYLKCEKGRRSEVYSLTEEGIKFFNILNIFLNCIK